MNMLRFAPAPRSFAWMLAACLAMANPAGARSLGGAVSCPPPSLTLRAPNPLVVASSPTTPLLASFWDNIMGNRRRMIQVGIVAVCVGIFFLSWSRK